MVARRSRCSSTPRGLEASEKRLRLIRRCAVDHQELWVCRLRAGSYIRHAISSGQRNCVSYILAIPKTFRALRSRLDIGSPGIRLGQ